MHFLEHRSFMVIRPYMQRLHAEAFMTDSRRTSFTTALPLFLVSVS